jgi:hypothetical protein
VLGPSISSSKSSAPETPDQKLLTAEIAKKCREGRKENPLCLISGPNSFKT